MGLTDPLHTLKGVGPEREKKLNKLGLFTVEDLLAHYPREYEDRQNRVTIDRLREDSDQAFVARVEKLDALYFGGRGSTQARLRDETGSVTALWFGQSFVKKNLKEGQEYLFFGRLTAGKRGRRVVANPSYESPEEGSRGLLPVYPLTAGLSQKVLRGLCAEALETTRGSLTEFLSPEFRRAYRLCERNYAVQNIHFPLNAEALELARRRLAFEELFLLQLGLLRLRACRTEGQTGPRFQNPECVQTLLEAFPYPLTGAQSRVLAEIQADMAGGQVCNRLVQGDVGSGKTAVAMAAAYYAIQNGYQAALMAPTEVLAGQHFREFQKYFEPLGIPTVLLTGSLTAKEKREALAAVARGEARMVVGTQALIQKNVAFARLGLVVTDEQHRFGVRQRGVFSQKGQSPHVLVMTATPIPRTLALILYGDLDISLIDELPPGRQEIQTVAVDASYHPRIYEFFRKEIAAGRQGYIICPMIEESEKLDVRSVVEYAESLRDTALRDARIGCLHGKLPAAEKQQLMEGFAAGKLDVLVTTTVVEVGVNVPNATIMLIENAERFGLAQLHQLRGRVGRGTEKSTCILVCDSDAPVAKKRMEAMKKTRDGFALSELDLSLRGPGEFFGTRQHGLPELKVANLYRDMPLLKEAQQAARHILAEDARLTQPEHRGLREKMEQGFFGGNVPL